MALKIVWTKRADTGFAKVIEYLESHFTEKEVRKFVQKLDKLLPIAQDNN
jgi:hypothetical protein